MFLPVLPFHLQLPPRLVVTMTIPGESLLPMLKGHGARPGQVRASADSQWRQAAAAARLHAARFVVAPQPWPCPCSLTLLMFHAVPCWPIARWLQLCWFLLTTQGGGGASIRPLPEGKVGLGVLVGGRASRRLASCYQVQLMSWLAWMERGHASTLICA